MGAFNLTPSDSSMFILIGIAGLEDAHVWISFPFLMSYAVTLVGNLMLLSIVGKEQTLHKPMYMMICMLALADIVTPSLVVPKTLCIFWFSWKNMTVGGCLTQMFFLHTVAFTQSAILVTMAYDRYVAICNPLRYTTILSNARIAALGLVGLIRAGLLMLPLPLLLSRLPFCSSRIILHTHCEHLAIAKLACGDISVNRTYSMVVAFVVSGIDLMLIALSYGLIIRAVFRKSSRKAHQKTLSTCTAHVCVMLTSYVPGLFTIVSNQLGKAIAPHTHIILANLYLLIPPMLNPVIYGIKTKEIRDKLCK